MAEASDGREQGRDESDGLEGGKKRGESEEFEFRLERVQGKCQQTRFLFAFGLLSLHSTSDAHHSINA